MNDRKKYVKSIQEYDENDFDIELSKKAQHRIKRKMPTSVSLSLETVEELKAIANKKGIPYQVLMRSFILEGLERLKDSA